MKVEAAPYYGRDVHDSTRESIAHDSGDGTNFFPSLWMKLCTEPPSSEEHEGVQCFQAARLPQDTMGTLKLKYYG